MKKIYLINTPILTAFGVYEYRKTDLQSIKEIINKEYLVSAIGHQPTADFLSQVLEYPVPYNRIQIEMQPNDMALVFKVKNRLEEGRILTQAELENTEIEYGLLERIS